MVHTMDKERILMRMVDKYVGEFKYSLYHGQGTFTFVDGTTQKGIFKNGEFASN